MLNAVCEDISSRYDDATMVIRLKQEFLMNVI
jgi:hypothetical protein